MRIGVIGLGFMGVTHLKALRNIPQAELSAVCSDIPERLTGDLSGIQGNLGGPGEKFDFSNIGRYGKIEDLLADPKVDAVDICLPTDLHAPVAQAALEAGKHVLVEKPMALTKAECGEILTAAEKAGKTLMVAQVLRFFPAYVMLRQQLKFGNLGPVRSAVFRRRCAAPVWTTWSANKKISGGGVFDLLIHDVDMCLHLFGKPAAYSAAGHEDLAGGIDQLHAHLHYDAIESVVVSGGWHHKKSYPFSMEYTVVTDGGTLEFNSEGRPPALYRADGEKQDLRAPDVDGYHAEIAYFVECAIAGNQPKLCPPAESADAVTLTNMLVEARKESGAKIPCKL
jgi:predicted dehydrogenase